MNPGPLGVWFVRITPPGPRGLSRLSSLSSLSSFGREVYLSLNLSPGAPNPILSLTLWWPAVSPNHIKRQARASKTPKTQAGYVYCWFPVWLRSFIRIPCGTNRQPDCVWSVALPKTIQNHWFYTISQKTQWGNSVNSPVISCLASVFPKNTMRNHFGAWLCLVVFGLVARPKTIQNPVLKN